MQSISTFYRGTRFRSRLEASWVAHFDKIALPWLYEPEGFTLDDGTNYLPDFYLPTARAWVEVKGAHNERIDKVEKFAEQLWRESEAADTYHRDAPMVLLLTAPGNDLSLSEIWAPWPVNILGPGKAGSAAFAVCDHCHRTTAVALWQRVCRNCGVEREEGLDWMESAHDFTGGRYQFRYLRSNWK